jgi:hypothetical protein
MSTTHRTDLEILHTLMEDPHTPFQERDLRELRSRLVRQEAAHLMSAARQALITTLTGFAVWLKPNAPDSSLSG